MDYEAINDFRFPINEFTCPLFPSLYALSEAVLKGRQFPFLKRSDPIAAKRMPPTSDLQPRSAPPGLHLAPSASRPDFSHHASGAVLSPVEGRTVNGKRTTAIAIFHDESCGS
jgi:hypothetical protein